VTVGWESVAADWIVWARDSRDAYWEFRDVFFALVPEPGRRTLEIGSGEGRVSRDLAARGHDVVGVEPSRTLRESALAMDADGEFVEGSAESLPFPDESFDLAVAYNSLMDVADMPKAVAEASRVMAGDGRLCICVTHPFADAGRFDSNDPDAAFVVHDSYLEVRQLNERFERDGLGMTFRGWCYPLEAYARAFESAGLVIERMREPAVSSATVARRPDAVRWQRMPMFLFVRCRKAGP
jgi:SAM-dependent methyltransferase